MPEKKPPNFLQALGREPLPAEITVGEESCSLQKVFKHDFFAVTAVYASKNQKVILKIGRKASLFGLPLGWIGRLHAWHESTMYQALSDVQAVPRFLGRFGKHGFIHEYIEGHELHKGEQVADDFFETLYAAIDTIHQRKMAYVDLEKCENVLVGDDGKPYLIDFQIAYHLPRKYGGELWPIRWLRRRLQQSDLYHLRKLQRRTRPDQLSEQELRESYRKPVHVRAHAFVTRPFTLLRRRILNRLDPRRKSGERGRIHQDPPCAV